MNQLFTLAQDSSGGGGGGGAAGAAAAGAFFIFFLLFMLAFAVFIIAAMWKIFSKAGQPGWAAIIPIYNTYIITQIVGRPWWWLLLTMIPFVGAIFGIILILDLAKSFGKSTGFAVGMILLGIVFFPILGFGKSQYQGPSVTS